MQTTSTHSPTARGSRVARHFEFAAAIFAGLALAAGLALSSGAAAQAGNSIADCIAISDDAERLACFDRLARDDQPVKPPPAPKPEASAPKATPEAAAPAAAEPPEPVPASPEVAQPPDEATRREEFGLERRREAEAAAALELIVASVVGGFRGWEGDTVFELDNGQVWEQVGSQRFLYSGKDRTVEIRRASLGSFLLSPEGLNRKVRVRRVD